MSTFADKFKSPEFIVRLTVFLGAVVTLIATPGGRTDAETVGKFVLAAVALAGFFIASSQVEKAEVAERATLAQLALGQNQFDREMVLRVATLESRGDFTNVDPSTRSTILGE